MTRERVGGSNNVERKPTPNLVLNKVVGSKVVGTIEGRVENPNYPGKFSTILSVEETDGSTNLWNKDKQVEEEVEIEAGDRVFLRENTVLARALATLEKGTRVEIVYKGKKESKKKGFKAAFIYDVFKLTEGGK